MALRVLTGVEEPALGEEATLGDGVDKTRAARASLAVGRGDSSSFVS